MNSAWTYKESLPVPVEGGLEVYRCVYWINRSDLHNKGLVLGAKIMENDPTPSNFIAHPLFDPNKNELQRVFMTKDFKRIEGFWDFDGNRKNSHWVRVEDACTILIWDE